MIEIIAVAIQKLEIFPHSSSVGIVSCLVVVVYFGVESHQQRLRLGFSNALATPYVKVCHLCFADF